MVSINGINEVAHPLLIFVPIILMLSSGYTIGKAISLLRKVNSIVLRDFVYGNITLCFLFIIGFIFFGVLTYEARAFFTFFTYALIALSIVGAYFLLKSIVFKFNNKQAIFDKTNIPILSVVFLFLIVLAYIIIIIYFHPIFAEYDSLYLYLLISKSILLGDGLNQDFYTGSDIAVRYAPYTPAMNAWIMELFGYSSLRLFPLYFVLMSSLMTYLLAHNLTKDSFLSSLAAILFLILPVTLVVSSRFSLQQDLSFIFFLTASFYFFSELVKGAKLAKTHLLLLILSLSLMILSREIGLILSIAIFFIILAVKFTKENQILKGIFTGLSLLPLYILSVYDLSAVGATYPVILRLITLLIANIVIFVITLRIRAQERPKVLLSNTKYLIPLVIPLIFIITNLLTFGGPYPSITLSEEYNQSFAVLRNILEIPDDRRLGLTDALSNLPRIDILFISVGLGSILILFKLLGFIKIIKNLTSNPQYAILLISITLLLVVWSYALDSNYELSYIRHLIYFAPLLSVIVVVGMNGGKREWYYRLYYYGVVVFSTFYFLSYNIEIFKYHDHFGGFLIDPSIDPIMGPFEIIIGAALGLVVLLNLRGKRAIQQIKVQTLKVYYLIPAFALLTVIEFLVLYFSGITLAPIVLLDEIIYPGWEHKVMDVIFFLNDEEEDGAVLSVHTPAISFFTNRTNFDVLYYPYTFAAMSRMSQGDDSFIQNLKDMDIRYIIIPNEQNQNYEKVQNLIANSNFMEIVEQLDESQGIFQIVDLERYRVYKLHSAPPED
ncbi:MAG: phospholipid carrier-dependent glycosyltransferase [Thermoproteota archaeon]|nr:phospholipid carrier-dependent glycosyltransferase [Thermoproteota archaeon]